MSKKITIEFSEKELVNLDDALSAYIKHLEPSAEFVPAVKVWQDKVKELRHKVHSKFVVEFSLNKKVKKTK